MDCHHAVLSTEDEFQLPIGVQVGDDRSLLTSPSPSLDLLAIVVQNEGIDTSNTGTISAQGNLHVSIPVKICNAHGTL